MAGNDSIRRLAVNFYDADHRVLYTLIWSEESPVGVRTGRDWVENRTVYFSDAERGILHAVTWCGDGWEVSGHV